MYHLSILLVVEWILRHRLSFLSHQELPERLLLTYKTEEAEKGPEPVQIVEEKEKPQSVEEPAPVPSSSEFVSPPPKPEIAYTVDLLVSREKFRN